VVEVAVPAHPAADQEGAVAGHFGVGEPSDASTVVRRFLLETRRRYSLSGTELERLVGDVMEELRPTMEAADRRSPSDTEYRVAMVECNDHQATVLARQLQERWGIAATPWNLSRPTEPPPGPIIGTRFHQGEMLGRWPERVADMRFAALRIDPATVEKIGRGRRTRQKLVLVERDVGTGHQHLEDLTEELGKPVDTAVSTVLPDLETLASSNDLYVIAPRLVDQLSDEIRRHPRVVILQHVFDPADMEALGEFCTDRASTGSRAGG
jgi:hypothetical protein